MLFVNSSGDMFLRSGALHALNSSVLHVVATAVDSGAPPRQVSYTSLFIYIISFAIVFHLLALFDLVFVLVYSRS